MILTHAKTSYYHAENGNATNRVHESFNKLAQARCIERCPAHEPFLEPPEEGAKKRVAKSKVTTSSLSVISHFMFYLYLLFDLYKI